MSWGLFFTYFSWLTTFSEAGASIFGRIQKISETLTLSLPSDQNHYQEGCFYRAVTSKQIKLEILAWSGFEGHEKIFPMVMWFFYLKFFLVEILPLEAKTYNCLTFHNLYQEGCLCQTITSKQIKLKIPAWSGFNGLEKFFPMVMWFFLFEIFFCRYMAYISKMGNC